MILLRVNTAMSFTNKKLEKHKRQGENKRIPDIKHFGIEPAQEFVWPMVHKLMYLLNLENSSGECGMMVGTPKYVLIVLTIIAVGGVFIQLLAMAMYFIKMLADFTRPLFNLGLNLSDVGFEMITIKSLE